MKNYYVNKMFPLTLKDLKKAQTELKTRKNQVYDSASYEFISVVSRVVKLSGMDVKLSDQTDTLDIVMYANALKKAAELAPGKYYRFSFYPIKNVLNSGNTDIFAFQVVGVSKISPNQITIHLNQCLKEKIGRQLFKKRQEIKQLQHPSVQIQSNDKKTPQNQSSLTSITSKIEEQITAYCHQLGQTGSDFDLEKISNRFNSKYLPKQIQRVLESLSQKGLIMDLGLAYQWVGEQE